MKSYIIILVLTLLPIGAYSADNSLKKLENNAIDMFMNMDKMACEGDWSDDELDIELTEKLSS